MIIAIIGSRSVNDFHFLEKCMDSLGANLLDSIEGFVSGGAKGADSLGEKWAIKNNMPTTIHYPDTNKYSSFKAAALARNIEIAEDADMIVAFWDGKSTGTQHCIKNARSMGKDVKVFRF